MSVGDRYRRGLYLWEVTALEANRVRYTRTGGLFSPLSGCVDSEFFLVLIDGADLVQEDDRGSEIAEP